MQAVTLEQLVAAAPCLIRHQRPLPPDGIGRRRPARLVADAAHQRKRRLPRDHRRRIAAIEPGLRDDGTRQAEPFRQARRIAGLVNRGLGVPFGFDVDRLADLVAGGIRQIVIGQIRRLIAE